MKKFPKKFFKGKLPIIIGIVLALILSAVFFIVLNPKNKDKKSELALYQQEFPQIFINVKDDF